MPKPSTVAAATEGPTDHVEVLHQSPYCGHGDFDPDGRSRGRRHAELADRTISRRSLPRRFKSRRHTSERTRETVAQSVATPIEQQMAGVDNMNYMYSLNGSDGSTEAHGQLRHQD